MTDRELARLFRQLPEREAFSAIYEDMKLPVYTVCLRILLNREAAEDVCHDVFLKLYTTPPDPSVVKVRAWIFRVARNMAIDALRRSQYLHQETLEEWDEPCYPQWDSRLDLEAALGKLPVQDREILVLHIHAGLGFAQIARITGLSLSAVYRSYRRAIRQLQMNLEG